MDDLKLSIIRRIMVHTEVYFFKMRILDECLSHFSEILSDIFHLRIFFQHFEKIAVRPRTAVFLLQLHQLRVLYQCEYIVIALDIKTKNVSVR